MMCTGKEKVGEGGGAVGGAAVASLLYYWLARTINS